MQNQTICVQGGYTPKNGEPQQLPIIQSTTFKYDSSSAMADLFDLNASGYFYSRLANPTNDAVAARIAELEGGIGAVLVASGQAATFYACFNVAECGDHIICLSSVYGGTHNLMKYTFAKMGIEVTFVTQDMTDEEISRLFRYNTKCVFGETLANPSLEVLDIERFARLAHAHHTPLIVDNTFATPINCRPFQWGADIIVHSTTKYIDGHGCAVGGVIVDSGNFDWSHAKYRGLNKPDESYHGIVYTEKFGKAAYLTKLVSQLMRDLGAMQKPQDAFYTNLGLQTLELRMKQHSNSARKVAEFLAEYNYVKGINYPGLYGSDEQIALSNKYLPNGQSGVISFSIDGGREAAEKFMSNLKLINIATHVADSHSIILHPAIHTHRQLSDEELASAGIPKDLMRLSIGLEDPEDLIADLRQALENTFTKITD